MRVRDRASLAVAPASNVRLVPWTFLTNYAHVLIVIAEDPTARIRDIALRVGITERAVQKIIAELDAAGYVTRARDGRRNFYRVRTDRPLRHSIERHCHVGALIALVGGRVKR